jgi:hypothetical protein
MSKLEQSHRDDWRLANHLTATRNTEEEIRQHLIDSRKYNGWANYETWSVNLILSNEQGLDTQCRELVVEAMASEPDADLKRVRAADVLKEWVTDEWLGTFYEEINNFGDAGLLASQLVSASLSEVDWLEIADAFAPES